ncbi:hypothetical protein SDRG_02174 [Saprolegnia diclina VS20]|uniref:Uncharacterized protein n=1 Tax=Saprolegnia diclina (strain VS20) TaxID=1156394 RepID=T0R1Q1_SAPDV|nr:hypothetical protein SDRG_02174 [Saprolegnia diclina VS20]EQC40270.1 hypothetical protein SDRG_02174 [Saprolegnia diclina VS20]|eukprot:XP_008605969.1 hypothetical protein SDRG_02174 [Saprolegnia diclina VS20]
MVALNSEVRARRRAAIPPERWQELHALMRSSFRGLTFESTRRLCTELALPRSPARGQMTRDIAAIIRQFYAATDMSVDDGNDGDLNGASSDESACCEICDGSDDADASLLCDGCDREEDNEVEEIDDADTESAVTPTPEELPRGMCEMNELLVHACACDDAPCATYCDLCLAMKRLLQCTSWFSFSAEVLAMPFVDGVIELFVFHATHCTTRESTRTNCSVPLCQQLHATVDSMSP